MLIIFYIILILRLILFPFLRILALFIPSFKNRIEFESRNITTSSSQGFKKVGLKAHMAFHFSSEGEFELIRPIIDELLHQNHLIELLYTSESVEKSVTEFSKLYPKQVRIFRIPLISFFPLIIGQNIFNWISARKLMMVRYDFLPELMCLRPLMNKMYLFAASSKSKSNHNWMFNIKRRLYESFDELIPTTKEDEVFFKSFLKSDFRVHPPLELRSIQIKKRQDNANLYHKNNSLYKLLISHEDRNNRFILSQMWPLDLQILDNENFVNSIVSGKVFLYLAPHKLDSQFVESISTAIISILAKHNISKDLLYIIKRNSSQDEILNTLEKNKKNPGIIMSLIPGLLCEIYPYFSRSYIGGGFGRGVHSLLEPFVGNCEIACGPNVYRSTEYDIVTELGISVFKPKELNLYFDQIDRRNQTPLDISSFIDENQVQLFSLLKNLDNYHA